MGRKVLPLAAGLVLVVGIPGCGPKETSFADAAASSGDGGGGGGGTGVVPPKPKGGPGDPPPPSPDPPPPPPSGNPIAGVSFEWRVNNQPIAAPAFVNVAGPAGAAKNQMSRHQWSNEIALTLYRRYLPGSAVSLLEVAIWNDPLVCQVQPAPGAVIPSQTIPNIDLIVNGASMYPCFPSLTCWDPVSDGQRYRLTITDPVNKKICDGAGFVWPFLVSTAGVAPKLTDLAALFPPNPGSMWGPVSPAFPSRSPDAMKQLSEGSVYFPLHADPWDVMGPDVKYSPTTGFQPDWYWCHLGAYYARGDLNDIFYVMPTVYRQAARPVHFYGFNGTSSAFVFNMTRPGKWGTNYLGRAPLPSANDIAPVADDHGWTGLDHQHASLRRVAEYAEATGSPFAWLETLHHGELAKPMMRLIDPAPYGNGFPNTPRGYLGWMEIAYRAWRLDPSYDMSVSIKAFEDFLELGHTQVFGKPWGQPQVMWAFFNDKWIVGAMASASFEDLRAVPILLKVGQTFNRPKCITGALEKCEWYATVGWTNGAEGKGLGIKYHVAPLDPANFVGADLWGYNRLSGLGYHLAKKYLDSNPTAGFNANLYDQVAELIWEAAHDQSSWSSDLAYWLPWK